MTLRFLTHDDFHHISALQDTIINHLRQYSNPRFIIKRPDEYITEHLSNPHAMVGYAVDGRHIAQAIYHAPNEFNITELGVDILPEYDHGDRVSVLQGIVIHPEFQGRGYMKMILADWQDWTKKQGIRHLAARTEAHHEASKFNFKKAGFSVTQTIVDPYDNASVCILHKYI